jgi:hypothetical protein
MFATLAEQDPKSNIPGNNQSAAHTQPPNNNQILQKLKCASEEALSHLLTTLINMEASRKTATPPIHHGKEVKLYKFMTSTIHVSVVGFMLRQLYSRRTNAGYPLKTLEKR